MLLNYFKLALRLLVRNPFLSAINIAGLSIGCTSFIALWLYSTLALTTDQHHKDFKRIARIGFQWSWTENGQRGNLTFGSSKADIIPELKNDFPEVESYVRILEQAGFMQDDLVAKHGTRMVMTYRDSHGVERILKQQNAAYADQNIFEFFTIPLIQGELGTVLSNANSIAVSKSTASKYFGKENPIGKELSLNDSIPLVVTGVYEDMPVDSRIHYDLILSNADLLNKWETAYWGGTLNFIKLKPGTSFEVFEKKINAQAKKYWGNILRTCNNCDIKMFAQPLKEAAFSQGFIADESFHHPSKSILITLQGVSIVILVMAWINYINLTVTRMSNRMKEFSTRRANGAMAPDLVKQFLTESFVVNGLAVGLSITLLQIIRQPLATFFEIRIMEGWLTKKEVWIVLLATLISGMIVTGLYPAMTCIARNRKSVFGRPSANDLKNSLATLLTTAQFAMAIVLISWVFIVYLQLNYILTKDIGLNKEGVVIIDGPVVKPDQYDQKLETLAEQLKKLAGVSDVALSRYLVGSDDSNKPGDVSLAGTSFKATVFSNGVNENYISFFGLHLLAGRNFVANDRSDLVIISKASAKSLGFNNPNDVIGLRVNVNTGNWQTIKTAEICGVIEDYSVAPFFNFASTNTIIAQGTHGLALFYKNKLFPDLTPAYIVIRISVKDADRSVKAAEVLYRKTFPGNLFEWRFLDDQINQAYTNEKIARNQILLFTVLAIGIACLGLIAGMTQRIVEKTKEIGIRKIFGAKDAHIGRLLLDTLLIQFIMASLLAIPLAYYLGSQYLQKYAERISIQWWQFIVPLCLLLLIMFFAIASMLVRAAHTNPVEALKYE